MKVVLSEQAKKAVTEIGDYIAIDSARRAQTFMRELRVKARSVGHAPRASPLLQRHEDSGIRSRPFGNYLIFYRIDDDRVLIVDIIHGARDYEAILFAAG